MKDEKYMIISKVLQICLLFSNNYVFVCKFTHDDMSSIFTPVSKTASVQVL